MRESRTITVKDEHMGTFTWSVPNYVFEHVLSVFDNAVQADQYLTELAHVIFVAGSNNGIQQVVSIDNEKGLHLLLSDKVRRRKAIAQR